MWKRDHPLFYHVMMGGKPWLPRNAQNFTRVYFDQFVVRGNDWWHQPDQWKRQGPAQFPELSDSQLSMFPEGYWDIEQQQWVRSPRLVDALELRGWTEAAYSAFMSAAIKRRTFAPLVPPREVLTRDGFIMEDGLEVIFTGGKLLHRHHWDTSKLLGKRMIAWHRHGAWWLNDTKGIKTYGNSGIKVREFGIHSSPLSWCVVPYDDEPFVIQSGTPNSTHHYLYIENPSLSLMTIDGRRISASIPAMPKTEPVMPL